MKHGEVSKTSRLVAYLLVVVLIASMIPTAAFAEATDELMDEPNEAEASLAPMEEEESPTPTDTSVPSEEVTPVPTEAEDPTFTPAVEETPESEETPASEATATPEPTVTPEEEETPAPSNLVAEGKCGDELSWKLTNDDTLTISGTGAMADYSSYESVPWYSYRTQIISVGMENGITSIGKCAFYGCSSLTSVDIPNSVTSIGQSAFAECKSLTSITIPNSVSSIGNFAFDACTGLTHVQISESVTSMGTLVFSDCSKLTTAGPVGGEYNIQFGWTKSIPANAFYGCTGLTSVTISGSITSIGNSAFDGCTSLANVYYDGTEADWNEITIGESNGSLTNATIHYSEPTPEPAATPEPSATPVEEMPTPTPIEETPTPTPIEETPTPTPIEETPTPTPTEESNIVASGTCGDNLTWTLDKNGTLTISGSGEMADFGSSDVSPWYAHREKITDIVIEEGVTSIIWAAFWYCTNLVDVTIPDTVTSIGSNAFFGCTALSSIIIPSSVTFIDGNIFHGCSGLTSIKVADGNPVYHSSGNCIIETASKMLISGCKSSVIPDDGSVTSIGESAFCECYGLTSIVIPDGVISIGTYAFHSCDGLTSIAIPSSVTSIERCAFSDCNNLTGLTVDNENTVYHAKGDCIIESASKTLTVGCKSSVIPTDGSVTSIGDDAFSGCDGLTSITIPDSVTSIGDSAFWACWDLTSVTIPSSVTTIGDSAFQFCMYLTDVYYGGTRSGWNKITIGAENEYLTDATRHYEGAALSGSCGDDLTWQLEPNGTLTISGTGAMADFDVADSLSPWYSNKDQIFTVEIADGVTGIGDYAFSGCDSLTSITIPSGVTSIGDGAFQGCTSIASAIIPNSVINIGDSVFSGCTNLKNVFFSGSESDWEEIVGENKSDLTNATVYYGCVYSGVCGDNLLWVLDDEGTLTVSGTGKMYDYNYDGNEERIVPWYSYRDQISTVVIGTGVTGIGNYAFCHCSGLISITIPDSVTDFGYDVFSDCPGLTTAGPIGGGYNIEFGWTKSIPDYVFEGCGSLISIVIPDSVTRIGNSAFWGCSSLAGITIPNGVTSIENSAFEDCTSLTSITIPSTVTWLCCNAFIGCTNLASMTVAEGNTVYHSAGNCIIRTASKTLIVGCKTSVIPNDGSVTAIDSCAFQGCSGLTSIIIPSKIADIGDLAFANCSGLTSVSIPSGVISIGSSAFRWCTSLKRITISDSVVSIGDSAFDGCSELTDVYYGGNESDWEKISIGTENERLTSATMHYALASGTCGENLTWMLTDDENGRYLLTISGTGEMTKDADTGYAYWYPYREQIATVVIEEGVTSISDDAFLSCYGLSSITIPDSVTSIGMDAFCECGLSSITIPESVTSIGSYAFIYCALSSVFIPKNVSSIGTGAFLYCVLTSLEVSSENTTYYSEGNCIIEKATGKLIAGGNHSVIPTDGSVTSIGERVFEGCVRLESVVIPEGVTSIEWGAFFGCIRLTDVTISKSVTSIGGAAFACCDSLTSMTVAAGNTVYHSDENCIIETESGKLVAGCKSSVIPNDGSVTSIGDRAFVQCKMTSVTIPDGVTNIGWSAFENCPQLTSVTIPSSVTSIGDGAFGGCDNLTDVYYSGSEEDWGKITIGEGNECLTNATIHYIGIVDEGTCGENLTWKLTCDVSGDTFILTISGTGEMTEYTSYEDVPWYSYRSRIYTVEIGDEVTSISQYAFYYCNMRCLTIPSSVISIGKYAFLGCTITEGNSAGGYMKVAEGNTVYHSAGNCIIETASKTLIAGCRLSAIPTDGSVTKIEEYAFYGCTGLPSVTIPSSVTAIGDFAFSGCTDLTAIAIPDNIVGIGDSAFSGCEKLKDVYYGGSEDAWKEIELGENNEALTGATIHYGNIIASGTCGEKLNWKLDTSGILTISGTGAMEETPWGAYGGLVTGLVLEEGITTISNFAFASCDNMMGNLVIPDTVTSIGSCAFFWCSNLTSLTISSGVTEIGTQAFEGCTGFTGDLVIPDSVTTIYGAAFNYCTGFDGTLTLSKNLTTIGHEVFWGCSGFTGDLVIPEGVTTIVAYAFYGCSGFNGTLTLPDGLVSIGESAFEGCSGFTGDLVIPNSVTELNNSAFIGCSGITSVVFGTGMTSYGRSTFKNCTGITKLTFRNPTVVEISNYIDPGNGFGDVVGSGPFVTLTNLTTVYVPAASYDAYVEAYAYGSDLALFSESVEFKKLIELELDAEGEVATGLPEGVTAAEVMESYAEKGETVTITDAEGNEVIDGNIGTGYQLVVGDETYTFVVTGDVNGDAEIDVNDLFGIVDCLNGDQALKGAYLQAACVCDEEDVSVYDFYSEIEYINTGSFSD